MDPVSEAALLVVKDLVEMQTLDQEATAKVLFGEDATQVRSKEDMELLYGDTPVESLAPLLQIMNENLNEKEKLKGEGKQVFLDIGSGRGQACFGMAALMNWKKVIGVEINEAYSLEASKSLDKLRDLEKSGRSLQTRSENIAFHREDALRSAVIPPLLQEADFVYCFDLAFPRLLRYQFAQLFATYMKDNALLLSLHTEPLPSTEFVEVGAGRIRVEMEWGSAPVRLYVKKAGFTEGWISKHQSQLLAADLPSSLWHSACKKIIEQNFDIGNYLQFASIDESQDMVMVATRDMEPSSHVFLVDHCLSFESKEDARMALETIPGLKNRVLNMVPTAERLEKDEEADVHQVLQQIQPYLGSYSLVTNTKLTVFYLLDEIGTGLRRKLHGIVGDLHCGAANLKIFPIYSHDYGMAFSLAWPISSISDGDMIFADHEQGWDKKHGANILERTEGGGALPEMNEYAAQLALNEMIRSAAQEYYAQKPPLPPNE